MKILDKHIINYHFVIFTTYLVINNKNNAIIALHYHFLLKYIKYYNIVETCFLRREIH